MKIEKINENQIRCTLNKEDLIDRQLRLSELAYGTEKAKLLFRDMMQQASFEFGFEAEDIPLMIEAIPISSECLVLVVTKVEDPDELDTRFSKFSSDTTSSELEDSDDTTYNDDIISCFSQLDDLLEENSTPYESSNDKGNSENNEPISPSESRNNSNKKSNASNSKTGNLSPKDLIKIYSFHTLDELIQLSTTLAICYHGTNSLYKDAEHSIYYLVLRRSDHSVPEFNTICNLIIEYGQPERTSNSVIAYYDEHFDTIIKDHAIQTLATL